MTERHLSSGDDSTVASTAAPPLAETQSLTEVRGEVSDPDRGKLLAETASLTKVRGEVSDPDKEVFGGTLDWERGERRPLLFRDAVTVTEPVADIGYDEALDVAIDQEGQPILASTILTETMTKTAIAEEVNDTDT